MHAARVFAVLGLCWMSAGCAAGNAAGSAHPPAAYVVRAQDTLFSIAWRHHLDYRDLARWNHVGGDFRLQVGQVLTLAPPGGHAAAKGAASTPAAPATKSASSKSATAKSAAPVARKVPGTASVPGRRPATAAAAGAGAANRDKAAAEAGFTWQWPTAHLAPPRAVPGGGILVLGTLGQDVRATATGRVVYTGSGLRGYGNLIIIKHGDTLLSSYAHNREMLVHEGQDVDAGQVIGHMGSGPRQIPALYFEIRVNGKPVDPLHYLPQSVSP